MVGTVGTWLGAGLRCFVGHNFMFVIVGQICCALSQAIILNAPTTIAVRWFLPQSVLICPIDSEVIGLGRPIGVKHRRIDSWRPASFHLCQSKWVIIDHKNGLCQPANLLILHLHSRQPRYYNLVQIEPADPGQFLFRGSSHSFFRLNKISLQK